MSNYLNAIISLRNEIQKKTNEFKKEIKPLEDALKNLRKINTACEYCNGTGIDYTYDAAGQKEQVNCNYCDGSGYFSIYDNED